MDEHDITESVDAAGEHLSELVGAVVDKGTRVVLTRDGEAVAAVVDLAALARLERLEDDLDLAVAEEALREGPPIPWQEVKDDLRLLEEFEARLDPEAASDELERRRSQR